MDNAVLSRALEAIHHIADEAPPWAEILARTSRLMHSDGAVLLVYKDERPLDVQEYCVETDAARAYVEHFVQKDVLLAGSGARYPGQWLDSQTVMPMRELERSEYYVDFMCRYRMRQLRSLIIEESQSFTASISFHSRSASNQLEFLKSEPIDTMTRAIQAAMTRRKALSSQWLAGAEKMFDALDESMVLVNASGAVACASGDAIRRLESRSALRIRGGALWHAQENVRHMLASVLAGVAASGEMTRVVVPGPSGRTCGIDVACAGVRINLDPRPLLLLRVRRRLHPASLEVFCAAHGVTRAESAVLASIVDGKTPKEISVEHGVALSTVRKQLANLMEKTGCARQIDLVRLLSSA